MRVSPTGANLRDSRLTVSQGPSQLTTQWPGRSGLGLHSQVSRQAEHTAASSLRPRTNALPPGPASRPYTQGRLASRTSNISKRHGAWKEPQQIAEYPDEDQGSSYPEVRQRVLSQGQNSVLASQVSHLQQQKTRNRTAVTSRACRGARPPAKLSLMDDYCQRAKVFTNKAAQ